MPATSQGFLIQHECLTSLMLLWMIGIPSHFPISSAKPRRVEGIIVGIKVMLMAMILELDMLQAYRGVMARCPQTFSYVVYNNMLCLPFKTNVLCCVVLSLVYVLLLITSALQMFTSSIHYRQIEMDEALGSIKEKFERERSLLTEENRKLTSETDRVGGNVFKSNGPQRFLVRSKH